VLPTKPILAAKTIKLKGLLTPSRVLQARRERRALRSGAPGTERDALTFTFLCSWRRASPPIRHGRPSISKSFAAAPIAGSRSPSPPIPTTISRGGAAPTGCGGQVARGGDDPDPALDQLTGGRRITPGHHPARAQSRRLGSTFGGVCARIIPRFWSAGLILGARLPGCARRGDQTAMSATTAGMLDTDVRVGGRVQH
jgi:hypothetical protein